MPDAAPAPGRLLVAAPSLADPNFSHAVILLLEHTDDGSLGVVLNRPSDTPVSSVLPGWEELTAAPDLVFVGGPVQPQALLGLARAKATGSALEPVTDGIAAVDLTAPPGQLAGDVEAVRLFVGYAGWGPSQLDDEVAAGGWFVVDAHDQDVFAADAEQLWGTVLRREGGIFRTIPENPSLN